VENFLELEEVLQIVPQSRSGIYYNMKKGLFPKPVKFGRLSRWLRKDIEKYIENCINKRGNLEWE
jgi:prophage regulatory protein